MAGSSLAHAQTAITDHPIETVIAQQPGVVVTQPAPVVATVPVQTVETVRTVRSATTPRHRMARRLVRSVTTTRTTVRELVVPAPLAATAPATPAFQAITQPGYTEVVQAAGTYAGPLYDVVGRPLAPPAPTGVLAQPVAGGAAVMRVPAYRYVYEPDRVLVIDANGIAVQALPR